MSFQLWSTELYAHLHFACLPYIPRPWYLSRKVVLGEEALEASWCIRFELRVAIGIIGGLFLSDEG